MAIVIGTLVMSAQVRHVRSADVGDRRDRLMLVPSLARSDFDAAARAPILHHLAALPLAVPIGCIGLWGPASFNTAPRVRGHRHQEDAGRSVRRHRAAAGRPLSAAGAAAGEPVRLAAGLCGMRAWLAGFDDRVALSPLYFVGVSAVALLTVLAQ